MNLYIIKLNNILIIYIELCPIGQKINKLKIELFLIKIKLLILLGKNYNLF